MEFVHSGMTSMIPPLKPRGSGCLVLLVHHLVALRPKHSNLSSSKSRQFIASERSRDKLSSVHASQQVERDSGLSTETCL